jgi:hypothetical protein
MQVCRSLGIFALLVIVDACGMRGCWTFGIFALLNLVNAGVDELRV